ncbi:hypothetical protein M3E75_08350 [Corynebacterium sanguinis]|uniref:hypothetical protein n=1 Tax=Corynebacterium sanguinis TaxID=2594913 RepID=UPI00223C0CA3|nr:hypothetical protein [Corynebacterium sanguinis]MCT1555957.1 hypothetical protein [Corynebacterium sanguinis]MCT1614306.1 hypothetical protein [Corynebacterium sanguinis]
MEVWTLSHPERGPITLERGYDAEFAELYPDWPATPEDAAREFRTTLATASIRERLGDLRANPPARLQVWVGSRVVARYSTISSGRIPLASPSMKMRSSFGVVDRSKPHLSIEANFFDDVLSVDYREGPTVVEFDPPEGSRGHKRRTQMESSAVKRVAYPLAQGLGKGGWALAVIILGPLVGRILQWLLQFLPDVEITLPSIYLPVPTLPQIYLPTPTIEWPEINLPEAPAWLVFLMEYSRIWIPIVIGLVIGIVAVRNHRKSEREKQRWHSAHPEAESAPGET